MRIGIFGAGYVGLVTGTCFADLGHHVTIRDIVPARVEALRAGKVPIYEPGLEELIEKNKQRMAFTTEIADVVRDADVLFVAVGTPPTHSGDADLSAVWKVVDEIPRDTQKRVVLVMKSTVPVGTGAKVRAALDQRGLANVGYVSNPEFLAEGSALADFRNPDRIVIGAYEEADGDLVQELHAGIDTVFVRADVASAEMVKLAANAALAVRISFINEIANVCELTGADVNTVAEGIGLDHRLGKHFLRAGIGFGGFCFPKDLEAFYWIAKQKGYDFSLLKAVKDINEHQKSWMMRKIEEKLWNLEGKTVAMLGLAFKPHTDDMRFAPAVDIIGMLKQRRVAVRATDPVSMNRAKAMPELKGVTLCKDPYETMKGADALLIVTEWPQYKALDWKRVQKLLRNPLVLDGRNLFDPAVVRAAGFEYCGVGRP